MTTLLPRRTVARGAAWAIPVIAVGAAVPLAAASPIDPPPVSQVNGEGCKEPGNSFVVKGASFKFGYRFKLVSTIGGTASVGAATLPGGGEVQGQSGSVSVSAGVPFYLTVYSTKSANGSGTLTVVLNGNTYTISVTTTGFPVCDR